MEVDGTAIKEISKLLKTPYILITFALASGLILFLPDDIINKMYMLDFRNKFGFVLGLIFWFSITLLIVMLGVKVYKRYENKRLNKKVQEGMKKFLLNMKNKAEIEVITQMLKEDDYTLELSIYSGVVIKLQHYCIITPAGNSHYVEMDNPCIPYFLQPGVFKAIEENEELQKKFKYKE